MATRNDFDDFFGDDEEVSVTDTRADGRLYRVPVARLSPNLVNPRKDFGTEDDLIDFGKSLQRRQIQACPVVSRNAYLKLWPDHRDQVKDIDYILVSGERRYRAANAVGLPVLDCIVNDDVATDRRTFMEAVVSENVDRQNFDPVEEAYAVQALVAEFGSNRAVAQHFERVDGWVTQRILLTHLAREVQDLVRAKKMPLEAARQLGKLAKDKQWAAADQLAWWEDEQERRASASAARTAVRKAARPPAVDPLPSPRQAQPAATQQPERFTAVKHDDDPEPDPVPPSPVPVPDTRPASEVLPEPRADGRPSVVAGPEVPAEPEPDAGAAVRAPKPFPYDDPSTAVLLWRQKMAHDDFVAGMRMGMTVLKEQHPDDFRAVLRQVAGD